MRAGKNIAICVADGPTLSAIGALGKLCSSAARVGGLTQLEQSKFAALVEHILCEFCDPEVSDGVSKEENIHPTPESETSEA